MRHQDSEGEWPIRLVRSASLQMATLGVAVGCGSTLILYSIVQPSFAGITPLTVTLMALTLVVIVVKGMMAYRAFGRVAARMARMFDRYLPVELEVDQGGLEIASGRPRSD